MHRARKLWFPLAITGVALTTACQDSVPTVTDTAEQAARPAFAVSSAGSLTVTVGQTIQLTSPNYRPRSGDFISLTPAMLKVTEAGLATGIAPGTAKAIFKNRYVCDTVIVSVVAPSTTPKVASVTVALPMSSVSLKKASIRSITRLATLEGWPIQIGVPMTRMSAWSN